MDKPLNTTKWGHDKAKERYGSNKAEPKLETSPLANEIQKPQDIQDAQDKGYDNDASGWVRGHGSPYPHFDKHKSGG